MTTGPGDGSPDDRTLLAAHVAGDPDAFGTLFARHRDRLWGVALRTTGDAEEAADALQDGMLSAFRRAESYRGDAAVTTWLHRIVVNACLDRLRRRKVRSAGLVSDGFDDLGHEPSARGTPDAGDRSDPEQLVLDDEQRAAVHAALDTLPPDQKAALVLVDMEGYSVHEVAEILQCPPGTIKSRCSRGRARLLPLLRGLEPGNPPEPPRVQPTTRPETERVKEPGREPGVIRGGAPSGAPSSEPAEEVTQSEA